MGYLTVGYEDQQYHSDWIERIGGDDILSFSGTDITVTGAGSESIRIHLTNPNYYTDFRIDVFSYIDCTATGYSSSYDGEAHGINVAVNLPASGATVMYGTEEGTYNLTESPKYTDAGTYTVYYQVTANNYVTKTGSAQVQINKIPASITAAPTAPAITYGQTLAQSTLNGGTANTDAPLPGRIRL